MYYKVKRFIIKLLQLIQSLVFLCFLRYKFGTWKFLSFEYNYMQFFYKPMFLLRKISTAGHKTSEKRRMLEQNNMLNHEGRKKCSYFLTPCWKRGSFKQDLNDWGHSGGGGRETQSLPGNSFISNHSLRSWLKIHSFPGRDFVPLRKLNP